MGTRTVSQTINLQTPDQTSKYITTISNGGITIHPAVQSGKSRLQLDGNGLYIKDENNVELATFGASGAQIGKDDETHLEMDYHSLQLKAKSDVNSFFHVSDLRDETGIAEVIQSYVHTQSADGPFGYTNIYLDYIASDTNYANDIVIFDTSHNNVTSQYEITISNTDYFRVSPNLETGYTLTVLYRTAQQAIAFTFGSRNVETIGGGSFAAGTEVLASGTGSHAEGFHTFAEGNFSHAEGIRTQATGNAAHVEGNRSLASGNYSHAEGDSTTASGDYSHAEGDRTTASKSWSHAEGAHTTASGEASHAEGSATTASGDTSHAEGFDSTAAGSFSHAEGAKTQASGGYSHAQNHGTIAQGANQTAIGKFNIANGIDYAFIIGNGTSDTARSNALTVDWSGDIHIGIDDNAGVGTTDGDLYQALVNAGLIT